MLSTVALLLGTATSAVAHQLTGTVYCEANCQKITAQVFPLGDTSLLSPRDLGKPPRTVEVPAGTAFTVDVAFLPVRVEVTAPGHAAGVFEVWVPEQVSLPPLWLPKAVTTSLRVTTPGGKGKVLVTERDAGQRLGRWRWGAPTTWVETGKTVTLAVPPGVPSRLTVLAESGCFAFANLTEGKGETVDLSCQTVTVTVYDAQGRP